MTLIKTVKDEILFAIANKVPSAELVLDVSLYTQQISERLAHVIAAIRWESTRQ